MRSVDIQNHLRTLSLPLDATELDVRLAYRELVLINHPDKYEHNPKLKARANETLKNINAAHSALEIYFRNGAPEEVEGIYEDGASNPAPGHESNESDQPPQPEHEQPQSSQPVETPVKASPISHSAFIFFAFVVGLILYAAVPSSSSSSPSPTPGTTQPISQGNAPKPGTCAKCGGVGRVKCEKCNGVGSLPQNVKCESCSGTGKRGIWPASWQCGECKGTGQSVVHATCEVCSGAGFVKCPDCAWSTLAIFTSIAGAIMLILFIKHLLF
jgi:DnaJ-class molecular chaperone